MDYRSVGLSRYHDGQYSEALGLFLAVETDPAEDSELAYFMGLCHIRLGAKDAAIQLFRQAIKMNDHIARFYQLRMLLAWLLIEKKNLDDAEMFLHEVIDAGFKSPQVWSALGYCQLQNDRADLALESYRQALEIDEENLTATNGLGYLLAETGQDLDMAIKLCEQALEQNPSNSAYKDSLGWALFRSGNIEGSMKYLAEAFDEFPDNPVIAEHVQAVKMYDSKTSRV